MKVYSEGGAEGGVNEGVGMEWMSSAMPTSGEGTEGMSMPTVDEVD